MVQRNSPALIFVRRTSDRDLAEFGLTERRAVWSFPSVYGAPVETQVFTIGLDPACT